MKTNYDLIIIGAGPGGYVAAIKAAKAGLDTAVIESRRAGGTCLNRGCIPAKAMIHAAEVYRQSLEGAAFGIHTQGVAFDYGEILSYKQETMETLVQGVEQLLKGNGVTLINGFGQLISPEKGENRVNVSLFANEGENPSETILTAQNVILATGSKPAVRPVPGMDLPQVLDSDGLFALDRAPKSLVIIGGGVIGVEFATVFSALGTRVTILEALPKILDNFDKEISQNLKMILKKRGVDIHTGAMVQSAEAARTEDGEGVRCLYTEKDKEQAAEGEFLLCAAGRTPNLDGLFAEGAAPEMNGRFIAVDEEFRTSIPGVWAIGDATGGIQLAHAASAHGIRVIETITGEEQAQDLSLIPGCVYTDPEIASVGITEGTAKEQGIDVLAGKHIMSANGKSLITREERGFIKVVADASDLRILGAQMMCARATDMIGEFTTAMANGLTVPDLLRGVRAHPTYNEGIAEALEDVTGESLHTMPRRKR